METDQNLPESIGIIGVGELASAIVDGLCDDADNQTPPTIVLSPRGASTSAELARRHPNVRVAADNQEVVDSTSMLLLAVRPEAWGAAMSGVSIAPGTLVVSALAGVDHDALHRQLGPEVTIVRAIPMPAVRRREGLTATLPAHPLTTAIFDRLGGTIAVADAAQFAALSVVSGAVSSHVRYLAALAEWATEQGLDPALADSFVRATFRGVSNTVALGRRTLQETVAEHETPGGLNEQLRRQWFDGANDAALAAALDGLLRRVG